MEGFKFKLRHRFPPERSVTQALQYIIATHDAFKKVRHSAVTSYLLQQINGMLFSQDVQGTY